MVQGKTGLTRSATVGAAEVIAKFQQNLDSQLKILEILEKLYRVFAENTGIIYVKDELCLLHLLLNDLYDMSVSISVAGLIKVGKSTVVNCLVVPTPFYESFLLQPPGIKNSKETCPCWNHSPQRPV